MTTKLHSQTTVYSRDFNSSIIDGDSWTLSTSTLGSWSRGSDVLNGGSDGTDYWHTTASDYNSDAVMILTSPTLDLVGTDLVLSLDVRYDTEAEYDGFQIEFSANGGVDWSVLGNEGDGINWYNESDLKAINDNEHGWSGDNQQWEKAYISLPVSLENNASVEFRVRFQSDGSNNDVGAAFDNFQITSGGTEIAVYGNGIEIIDGDITPSETDNTDFRSVDVTDGSKVKIYTIINTLSSTLTLDPTPVSLSGSDAADFSISQPSDLSLSAGESTTFTIQFDPSSSGVRSAVVTIDNSDSDESEYTFEIEGNGVSAVVFYDFSTSDDWTNDAGNDDDWSRGSDLLSDGADGDYWHTSPSSGYNSGSTLIIESDPIDLTGLSDLILYVDIRYDAETTYDGFKMQYNDNGGGWTDIGSFGEGVNWYVGNVDELGTDGWTGDNERWQTAEIELPTLSNTQFRVAFQSDGVGSANLGAAFDNFMIAAGAADIYVEGYGIEIENGENVTSSSAGTDFRSVDVTSGTNTKTFTIRNFGGGTLNLTGSSPIVDIVGDHPADFTVSSQPSLTALDFLEETTFTVVFDPSASGTRQATVSISNDDSDDNPFTFLIAGVGSDAEIYHDFESSDHGWTVTSTASDWIRGTSIFSTGADGTYWHTGPLTTYGSDDLLTIESPTLDFTSMNNLSLQMDIRYDTDTDTEDGWKIEYSDDDGTTWYDLGQHLDDYNWYNDTDISAFDGFNSTEGEDGWSGDNGIWEKAEIDLPADLENNSTVKFRMIFKSDADANVDVGAAFDNFAIYSDVVELTLPVELLDFSGVFEHNTVSLTWSTGSELNNDYFIIQHSSDGNNFTDIGEVEGSGTINEIVHYQFVDTSPFTGHNYYRLKQVDFDGVYEIFDAILVFTPQSMMYEASIIYPNPASSHESVFLSMGTVNDPLTIFLHVSDLSGKVLFNSIIESENGGEKLDISSAIPKESGVYVVRIVKENVTQVKRIVRYE